MANSIQLSPQFWKLHSWIQDISNSKRLLACLCPFSFNPIIFITWGDITWQKKGLILLNGVKHKSVHSFCWRKFSFKHTLLYAGVQSCFKSRGPIFITLIFLVNIGDPKKLLLLFYPKMWVEKYWVAFSQPAPLCNYVPVDVACKKSLWQIELWNYSVIKPRWFICNKIHYMKYRRFDQIFHFSL